MSKEEWRAAPGYVGLYEVSDQGRVRRIAPGKRTYPGYILSPRLDSKGYPQVGLTRRNGKQKHERVHRLVALAFLPPDPNRPEVNHKNGKKDDPRAVNLEWATRSENVVHARDVLGRNLWAGIRGERHGMAKVTEDQVREIRRLYATGQYSHQQLANMFGLSKPETGKIIRGEFWTHVR